MLPYVIKFGFNSFTFEISLKGRPSFIITLLTEMKSTFFVEIFLMSMYIINLKRVKTCTHTHVWCFKRKIVIIRLQLRLKQNLDNEISNYYPRVRRSNIKCWGLIKSILVKIKRFLDKEIVQIVVIRIANIVI